MSHKLLQEMDSVILSLYYNLSNLPYLNHGHSRFDETLHIFSDLYINQISIRNNYCIWCSNMFQRNLSTSMLFLEQGFHYELE